MTYQSEASLENKLIEQLISIGYEKVKINNEKELMDNFRVQLNKFNKMNLSGVDLTDKEFQRIINHVYGNSVFESSKILRDKYTLEREDGTIIFIKFIDDKFNNNTFQVSNQITMKDKRTNRYDVTILINGIPLIQIELKRRGMDINEAFNQVQRYRRDSYKGLFKFVQIYIISNGVDTKYFANSDAEILKSFSFYWTDFENKRISNLQDFTNSFLNKSHLIKMITKYTIVNETDKILIAMRPYQIYATEALVKRAIETKNNGYIWHTTGSGKTLTSWMCANILSHEPSIDKVIFLVDRKDLDLQTVSEFNKFEEGSVDFTDNTRKLIKQLKDENQKLIVTTIQKMSSAINKPYYNNVFEKYKDKKVIFIIDECHRSQFGKMHKDIKKTFLNAQFFGFTGTPRFIENKSQDERTTADIFEKCLHSYLIKEAISDKNVLGFSVEYIETFKGQYDEEDKTLVEAINIEEIYNNEERISMIANHIVQQHDYKSQHTKYTALFAVSSIDMLIKYYNAFKAIRPPHEFKVGAIFTFSANEDLEGNKTHSRDALEEIIKDYNKLFGTNFSTDTFSAYHVDVSKKVKTAQLDILIVVNMFLTGFDSRTLNTLYVDKNLKYHDLLQAFSRTNRVEKETKVHGNIVCYRNLKKETDAAIRLFSKTDCIDDVLLKDYDYYLDKFNSILNKIYSIGKEPEDINERLPEEKQKEFVLSFKELSKLLLIMKTFVDFKFDEQNIGISEQTYEDYKSKYFTIYDNVKKGEVQKASVLNDIDFNIELLQTDKINVSYIMNLIRNIDYSNEEQKKREIEHTIKELNRTDNPQLRRKVDLLKKFLEEVAPNITYGTQVDDTYNEFESIERNKEVIEFATENNVEPELLKKQIEEVEYTGIFDRKELREVLKRKGLKFKESKIFLDKIKEFIFSNIEKYE